MGTHERSAQPVLTEERNRRANKSDVRKSEDKLEIEIKKYAAYLSLSMLCYVLAYQRCLHIKADRGPLANRSWTVGT